MGRRWTASGCAMAVLLCAGSGPTRGAETKTPEFYVTLGDFDGDKVTDVAVGLPELGSGKLKEAGEVRIYSGKTGLMLTRIPGTEAGEAYGSSLASIGDIDKDEATDLAIGSPFRSAQAGIDFVSGKTGKRIRVMPCLWDGFGDEICPIGDGSRRRETDIIVRSTVGGSWTYVYAAKNALQDTVKDPDATLSITRPVGDVDGDGAPDFGIGKFAAPVAGMKAAGTIRVLSGRESSVASKTERDILLLKGDKPGATLGLMFGPAGDWDSDRRGDLVVGLSGGSQEPPGPWKVLIMSGANGAVLWDIAGKDGETRIAAVLVVGDVNADGIPDVAITRSVVPPNGTPDREGTMVVTLYSGADKSEIWSVNGEPGEFLGDELLALRDADGDGCGDLVVTAPLAALDRKKGKGMVRFLSGKTGARLRVFNPLETK